MKTIQHITNGMMLIATLLLVSCSEFEAEKTAFADYSGDWYYRILSEDGTTVIRNYSSSRLTSYTSASGKELIFDDHEQYFNIRVKFAIQGEAAQFTSGKVDNLKYEINKPSKTATKEAIEEQKAYKEMAITEGRILHGMATSKSGKVKTDSLYLKVALRIEGFRYSTEKDSVDTTEKRWFDTIEMDTFRVDTIFTRETVDTVIGELIGSGQNRDGATSFGEKISRDTTLIYRVFADSINVRDTTIYDTFYRWIKGVAITPEEKAYIISGHRYTGWPDDDY